MKKTLLVLLVSFMVLGLMSCGTPIPSGTVFPVELQGTYMGTPGMILAGNQAVFTEGTNSTVYYTSFKGLEGANARLINKYLTANSPDDVLDEIYGDDTAEWPRNLSGIIGTLTLSNFEAPYDRVATVPVLIVYNNGTNTTTVTVGYNDDEGEPVLINIRNNVRNNNVQAFVLPAQDDTFTK